MSFRTSAALLLAVLAVPALSGCGPQLGGDSYSAYEARQSMTTYNATAVAVRQVNISSDTSERQTMGGVIGAVAGGVIGSTMGHHSGRTLATLGGALLGGAAGAGIGHATGHQTGLEITVQYENGAEETVVQGATPPIYSGQAVRVLVSQDGTRRIEPR
ncbi:MAG: glycine zipper 2TM domain-containing protein [Mailhella sp.]|nr:glycine zipper 2TM domain-containing protein [Mailhella sp.]